MTRHPNAGSARGSDLDRLDQEGPGQIART
jgi:hypothetical protein